MKNSGKAVSSPISSGGGGHTFEVEVQTSFVMLMLVGGYAPGLPLRPIQRIKLQGRYAGYTVDDLIVFTANPDGSQLCKLFCQMKRAFQVTHSNSDCKDAVASAWANFHNRELFTPDQDAIAIITGPLTKVDTASVRTLLEWARSSVSADEFHTKVETAKFSSKKNQEKLGVLRAHVEAANGAPVTDDELWEFLRHLHLLGYDLDVRAGVVRALLHSMIRMHTEHDVAGIWGQVLEEVMYANQNAGTITRSSLPKDLRALLESPFAREMPEEIAAAVIPEGELPASSPEHAKALSIAMLLGEWNEQSPADMAVVSRLAGDDEQDFLRAMREVILTSDSPIRLHNGVWSVKDRSELWERFGSRLFDDVLDTLGEIATDVLSERDPRFDLDAEKRFSAPIYGKTLPHSQQLRRGIAETLALLGSRPGPLVNCSTGKAERTAWLAVREVLRNADWRRWASLNSLIPTLAEAAPTEFVEIVEEHFRADPSIFDELFAQEGSGIGGGNYMTGLLWALEALAWDEQYFVRVLVLLAALASRDPGGSWANRPSNSLTTILLPWLPQTTAPIQKRRAAVEAIGKEYPEVAWKLLQSLLPRRSTVSSGSHKPTWRQWRPADWTDGVTRQLYAEQVETYGQLLLDAAGTSSERLLQLISSLDHLPHEALNHLLSLMEAEEFKAQPEHLRLLAWESITSKVRKHRLYADANWVLPEYALKQLEKIAADLAPSDPEQLYRHLFPKHDRVLYEEKGNWQEQTKKLGKRREDAIKAILASGGFAALLAFGATVEAPYRVGFSLGQTQDVEFDTDVLPALLEDESEALRGFAAGYVVGKGLRTRWEWAFAMDRSGWTREQIAKFFLHLPFGEQTWDVVEKELEDEESLYWEAVGIAPYADDCDFDRAAEKLLEHGRPKAVVHCLAFAVHDKKAFKADLAIRALLEGAGSDEPQHTTDQYDITELIQALQRRDDVDDARLLSVEWTYLPLLDRYSGAAPVLLERRLASDPAFFCEVIGTVYRSSKDTKAKQTVDEQQRVMAERGYQLLREWQTPPGTAEDGTFSDEAFLQWLEQVQRLAAESGHLQVALQHVGGVLIHTAPADDGLPLRSAIADLANRDDLEQLRRGYCLALYNSRGAHYVDPTGTPEIELARKYEAQADQVENAGYFRIAASLRSLADRYRREAQRLQGGDH